MLAPDDRIKTWFDVQMANKNGLSVPNVLYPIKEIFDSDTKFNASMQQLKACIDIMYDLAKNKSDKDIIGAYREQINTYLSASAKLDMLSAISASNATPEQVLSELEKKYNTEAFKTGMNTLPLLEGSRNDIDAIFKKMESRLSKTGFDQVLNLGGGQAAVFTNLTPMPFQRIMRYQMPVEEVNKNLLKQQGQGVMGMDASLEYTGNSLNKIKFLAMEAQDLMGEIQKKSHVSSQNQNSNIASFVIEFFKKFAEKLNLACSSVFSVKAETRVVRASLSALPNTEKSKLSTLVNCSVIKEKEKLTTINPHHVEVDGMKKSLGS